MNNFPFTRCLRPRKIVNPYTHETMIVPCGHCKACLTSKQSRLTLQCDLESKCCMYTVFVTLTYANRFIPRLSVVCDDSHSDPDDPEIFPIYTFFDKETGEIIQQSRCYRTDVEMIQKKTYLFGDIPYLRKSDLQKFIKRLRFHIDKKCHEKIRYYAVGEYGPVHFRPHFHILLFVTSKEAYQMLDEYIRSCWTFGRVDCQLSKGSANSYVASYVNSNCNLPTILMHDAVRPFSVHSRFLGLGFFESQRSEVYSCTASEFIKRSIELDGAVKEFNLWRSAYSVFFPKCKGFSCASTCERTYRYILYRTAKKYYQFDKTIDIARTIATEIFLFDTKFQPIDNEDRDHLKFLRYFRSDFPADCNINDRQFVKFVYSIYVQLLLSKHFLEFCCGDLGCDSYSIKKMVAKIEEFYKDLDYMHLRDFYENQQMYFQEDYAKESDLVFFYDNMPFDFNSYKDSPIYKLYDAHIYKLFSDRIKHKVLNDSNQIFFDQKVEVLI